MTSIISNSLKISIAPEILAKFPETKVSFMLAKIILTPKPAGDSKAYLEAMKKRTIQEARMSGLSESTYANSTVCQSWRKVFTTFGLEEEKQSTIETGLKRIAKECDKVTAALNAGKKEPKPDIKRISNFVDFYNLISIQALTPMGALNLDKIEGDIELRYGKEGEKFSPLGKTDEVIDVKPEHIVYADQKSILTWLWNYRDAKHACVPDDSEGKEAHILLFADQAEDGAGDAEKAISLANEQLAEIGGTCLFTDTLSVQKPMGEYDLSLFLPIKS